ASTRPHPTSSAGARRAHTASRGASGVWRAPPCRPRTSARRSSGATCAATTGTALPSVTSSHRRDDDLERLDGRDAHAVVLRVARFLRGFERVPPEPGHLLLGQAVVGPVARRVVPGRVLEDDRHAKALAFHVAVRRD